MIQWFVNRSIQLGLFIICQLRTRESKLYAKLRNQKREPRRRTAFDMQTKAGANNTIIQLYNIRWRINLFTVVF